jgi:hypothetical protein
MKAKLNGFRILPTSAAFSKSDDTIRTMKSADIVRQNPFFCGPEEPTVEKLERWAAGDGGASEAADPREAFDLWDRHA